MFISALFRGVVGFAQKRVQTSLESSLFVLSRVLFLFDTHPCSNVVTRQELSTRTKLVQ